MADVKISDFPLYSGIIGNTDLLNGLVFNGTDYSNYNYTFQNLSDNVHNYDSLSNTVYVGSGSSLQYATIYDAWEALKLLPYPCVNIICINNGASESYINPIEINSGDPALSITILNGVSKNFAGCQIIANSGADAVLTINTGAGGIIKYNAQADGDSFIDFTSNSPNSIRFHSDYLTIENQSDLSFANCNTLNLNPATNDVDIKLGYLNVTYPDNPGGSLYLKNAVIDTFIANAATGTDATNVLFNSGYLIIDKFILTGNGFADGASLGKINNSAVINCLINNTSAYNLTITSMGGSINNIMGYFKVFMMGDEIQSVVPMVSNANNLSVEFVPTPSGTADNSAGMVSNAVIVETTNLSSQTGSFKFSNCVFTEGYNWNQSGFVFQASNCQFTDGYSIPYNNHIITNGLAGYSIDDVVYTYNFNIEPTANKCVVVATTADGNFNDVGTDTEQGFNTTIA